MQLCSMESHVLPASKSNARQSESLVSFPVQSTSMRCMHMTCALSPPGKNTSVAIAASKLDCSRSKRSHSQVIKNEICNTVDAGI